MNLQCAFEFAELKEGSDIFFQRRAFEIHPLGDGSSPKNNPKTSVKSEQSVVQSADLRMKQAGMMVHCGKLLPAAPGACIAFRSGAAARRVAESGPSSHAYGPDPT
jgi:hypothetical protein